MNKRTGTRVEIEWAGEEPAHRRGKIADLFQASILPLAVWHVDRRIRDANEAYLKLVGYTRGDISTGTLTCDRLTPIEYLTLDEQAIEQLRQGKSGICKPFQKEYIRRDGSRIPVLVGGALLPNCKNAGIAFALDLTKHSSAQKALAAREGAIAVLYAALLGKQGSRDFETSTLLRDNLKSREPC